MRLISGPPASGKSRRLLEEIRRFLDAGDASWRLLVPTATMAEHLRNAAARDGFVFRPSLIATLSRFLVPFHAGFEPVTPGLLAILVDRILTESAPREFRKVAGFPGFSRLVSRLVDEFALAGCHPSRLAILLANPRLDAPLGAAFLEVYEAVTGELSKRKLALRGQLLAAAAERIRRDGLGIVRRVYLDGFFSFNTRELEVLRAMDAQAEVSLAVPDWEGTGPLRSFFSGHIEEDRLDTRRRPEPSCLIVTAPTAAQEADEIARRILGQAAGGRPFREMGVIVRSGSSGAGAIESAFSRFGIPARFYFAQPLASQPVIRYLTLLVEARLSGWDHEMVLAALRTTPSGFGGTPRGDRLDFEFREMLPGKGLGGIAALVGRFSKDLLDGLERFDGWPAAGTAANWAARTQTLRALAAPGRLPESPEEALLWRSQAAALDAFDAAAREAAQAAGTVDEIAFEEFWKLLETVLRTTNLRVPDRRRDVVHVIDVYEARQWELPVVFVSGLLEKEFPRYHSQDPIFNDAARACLQAAGVNLRTAAERQREEEFLFDVATTRASEQMVLSHSRFDALGEENLPSFFLERFRERSNAPEDRSRPVRRAPARAKPLPPAPAIREEGLLAFLRERHTRLSPTSVEIFLHCPFQFFTRKTLRLGERPETPRERLSALLQGKILHAVLARLAEEGVDPLAAFEEVFGESCRDERVPEGYRREAVRFEMIRYLSAFLRDSTLPPQSGSWSTEAEKDFEFTLTEGLQIIGRIDRLEINRSDGLALVIDYKYSPPERVHQNAKDNEKGQLVQGGLYMLAAERCFGLRPAGMLYCGLKKAVSWSGWHVPLAGFEKVGQARTSEALRELLDLAAARTHEAAEAIAGGRIAPQPVDAAKCRYCELYDICRYETAIAVAANPAERSQEHAQ